MQGSIISYEDLLYPEPILVKGVGHIRSPKLKELAPDGGYGWDTYSVFIFFLKAGLQQLRETIKIEVPEDAELFNFIISDENLRELYLEAFSFFISEHIIFDHESQQFLVYTTSEDADGNVVPILCGAINSENFDTLRAKILLRNYISSTSTDVSVKHSSKKAEDLWNRAQEWMAKLEPKKTDDTMSIGNLLSKLCAIHPSINYLNVFDLTIFQFYDNFFQCSYLRSVDFTQDIVSTHGSKDNKFNYGDWMKPMDINE